MIDPSKIRAFRAELAELYETYGLVVTSCGCCQDQIEVREPEAARAEALALDLYGRPDPVNDEPEKP